jgi:hypothetical protein
MPVAPVFSYLKSPSTTYRGTRLSIPLSLHAFRHIRSRLRRVRRCSERERIIDDAAIRGKAERKSIPRAGMNPKMIFIRGIDEPAFRREEFHRFTFRPDEFALDLLPIFPVTARLPVVPANRHVNERAVSLDHDLIDIVAIDFPGEQLHYLALDPGKLFRQGWDPSVENSAKIGGRLSQQHIALRHRAGGVSMKFDEGFHGQGRWGDRKELLEGGFIRGSETNERRPQSFGQMTKCIVKTTTRVIWKNDGGIAENATRIGVSPGRPNARPSDDGLQSRGSSVRIRRQRLSFFARLPQRIANQADVWRFGARLITAVETPVIINCTAMLNRRKPMSLLRAFIPFTPNVRSRRTDSTNTQ